ncbi:hypothetical protein [Cellulomonas sp. URHD0024]|uniref:hypothetical protein n=1 Tax=Cellulomonas sp. URHD0024 TaxID=1302620 RepID=UPI00040AE1DD|nr:hypothetical protein [Cellulomonas sp. URHD0024]
MAFMAFGRRLSLDSTHVRYDYGLNEADPARGVLVIPIMDPSAWFMEGRDDRPGGAARVAGRAALHHERTGERPENASVFS